MQDAGGGRTHLDDLRTRYAGFVAAHASYGYVRDNSAGDEIDSALPAFIREDVNQTVFGRKNAPTFKEFLREWYPDAYEQAYGTPPADDDGGSRGR